MPFDPFVSTDSIVVLVIDRNHPRFGQLARLNLHNWLEDGLIDVSFADNKSEDFFDDDTPQSAQMFYRRGRLYDSKRGDVETLRRMYVSLGIGTAEQLKENYAKLFHEPLVLD